MNFTQSAPLARVLAVLWAAIMVGAIMLVALFGFQIRTDGIRPIAYTIYLVAGFVYGVANSERDYHTRYLPQRRSYMPLIPYHYSADIVRWTYAWLPVLLIVILFKGLLWLIGPPVRRRV